MIKLFENFNVEYNDIILIKKNNDYLLILDLFIVPKESNETIVGIIYPEEKRKNFTIYRDEISENEYQTDDNDFINIIEISDDLTYLKTRCDKLNKTHTFNL